MNERERNKRTVVNFVEAINRRDWRALEAIVSADFRRHSHAAGDPSVKSRDELITFLQRECETFADGRETIEDMIAEGCKVAVRHAFVGTQTGFLGSLPPSGRTMMVEYLAIYRIRNDRIVEAWAEWDNAAGIRQLGHADGGIVS